MYGLVLMAALSSGGTAPASDATPMVSTGYLAGCGGGFGGCGGVVVGGCYGGCGGVMTSCYGGCAGCYGGCAGCFGGCGGRGILPLFPRLRSRVSGTFSGCRGYSCYGSACYGASCFGSCVGCTGGGFGTTCFGCAGASCFGTACYGFNSCIGGPVYYGADFAAPASYAQSYTTPHVSVGVPAVDLEVSRALPQAAPARLTVELPADAKLYVDGTLTKTSGATRNFHTPDLKNGNSYFYDLKAEIVVDGKTVVEEARVIVKAGDVLSQSFPKLLAAVKSSRDALAAK